MASADESSKLGQEPAEAQRIAERAAETLVAPGSLLYVGEAKSASVGLAGVPAALNPAEAQRLAERAAEALFARDATAKMLGIQIVSVRPGGGRVSMTVRHDMVNGHRTCHGGLIFSLADSAFAVACNSYNESNVAAAASIDFLAPGFEGDELCAEAAEVWRSGRTGIYEIKSPINAGS